MLWLTIILVVGIILAIFNAVACFNNLVLVISFVLIFLGGIGLIVLQLMN